MANLKVMIEYVEKLDDKEWKEFMDMMKKYNNEIYWDIIDYGMEKYEYENVDLEEDYDVIKEIGGK